MGRTDFHFDSLHLFFGIFWIRRLPDSWISSLLDLPDFRCLDVAATVSKQNFAEVADTFLLDLGVSHILLSGQEGFRNDPEPYYGSSLS